MVLSFGFSAVWRGKRAGAGNVNDDVRQGRAQQDNQHNIADAAHRTPAADVVARQRGEKAVS